MASITKREGKKGPRWDVRWREPDGTGQQRARSESFDREREAKKFLESLGGRKPGRSEPLKALTDAFIANYKVAVKHKQREASTLAQLQQHINLHILSDTIFAGLKCDEIMTPQAQGFLNRLYARVTPQMAVKVRSTLSSIFDFGAREGFVGANPVTSTKLMVTERPEEGEAGRKIVIPAKADVTALLAEAKRFDNTGRSEAFVRMATYGGLRVSELRGLPKTGLDFGKSPVVVSIIQRADRYNELGRVKSKMSRREVVIGPETAKVLQRWLESAPDGRLVFPNDEGNIWSYSNLWNRWWVPLMNRAGLVTDKPASKVIREYKAEYANYCEPRFGLHDLRHVYASLQIEQGVIPKRLQALMGHSTLKLTMDTYGHLWPDPEQDKLAANVENLL